MENELEEADLRKRIHEGQTEIYGDRGEYSKIDSLVPSPPYADQRMPGDLRPVYNSQVGSEKQYITGVSVHQNSNDGSCFKNHMEQIISLLLDKPQKGIVDTIFGTEEIYEFLNGRKIEALLKYPSYDKE